MDAKRLSYAFLIISLFSGASLPVLLGLAGSLGLYEFLLFVSIFALISSIIFVIARGKADKLLRLFSDWRMLAIALVAGLFSVMPIELGIGFAEHYITASLATAIFRTSPLLMLLLLPVILRERLSKYQIAALAIGFLGVYIGVSGGGLITINAAEAWVVLFMAAMALIYALSNVLVKRFAFDMEVQLAAAGIAFFVFSAAVFALSGAHLQTPSPADIALALYIGAFFNVYSFYMAFYALRRLKTTLYTNVYMLSPFITFVFSYALLGEAIKLYYLAIAAAVACGIVIQRFDRAGGTYMAKSKSAASNVAIFDVTGIFSETGEQAINASINSGGRVLGIKLPSDYRSSLGDVLERPDGKGLVYTDSHEGISNESGFVRDVMGVKDGEFALLRVGHMDECEDFFESIRKRISS